MRRLITIIVTAAVAVGIVGSALASQPPGLLGNEGQPGNQGGAQHNP
jgi:hypothetical protein